MGFFSVTLPLGQDSSGRFLPWIMAFMVYIGMLALASSLALDRLAARWNTGLQGSMTVMLPPQSMAAEQTVLREKTLQVIRTTPWVTKAAIIDPATTAKMLEPWLGNNSNFQALPIPDLIAVEYQSTNPVRIAELRKSLAIVSPDILLDDHQGWLSELLRFAESLQGLSYFLILVVEAATVITVIFVTRTGLAINRRIVDIVHLVGAPNRYIAKQFQNHSLRLGIMGGIIGACLAGLTLLAIEYVLGSLSSIILPKLTLSFWHWVLLSLLPVSAGIIAMLTARYTVLRSLS